MKSNRLPVVYDCMIFLQGLVTENGVAFRCLELVENGEIELLLSQEILWEIEDVLTRPKLQAKFPLLTRKRADKLLELLKLKGRFVKNVPQIFKYNRDPKDEKYISLAVAAKAEYNILSPETMTCLAWLVVIATTRKNLDKNSDSCA